MINTTRYYILESTIGIWLLIKFKHLNAPLFIEFSFTASVNFVKICIFNTCNAYGGGAIPNKLLDSKFKYCSVIFLDRALHILVIVSGTKFIIWSPTG